MTVLVTFASKYGATEEIGVAIGRALAEHDLETDVRSVEQVDDLAAYDAIVLGSGVYAGHWLGHAREFVEKHAEELASRPTWLFSSGPIGEPPRPAADESVEIDAIVEVTHAREHRVFAGKLDKSKLSFPERAVVFAFRAAEGDFRDWDAVVAWASDIAAALSPRADPR